MSKNNNIENYQNKEVFAYYRVSTDKQDKEETYEYQYYKVRQYAESMKLTIKQEFLDAISGSIFKRKNFDQMLHRIDSVSGVILYDLDRLVRDFEGGLRLILLFKEKSKILYNVREQKIETFDSDIDDLMMVFRIWADARERKKIVARLRSTIEMKKEKGEHWGRKPVKISWKQWFKWYYTYKIRNVSATCRILGFERSTFYRRKEEFLKWLKKEGKEKEFREWTERFKEYEKKKHEKEEIKHKTSLEKDVKKDA